MFGVSWFLLFWFVLIALGTDLSLVGFGLI